MAELRQRYRAGDLLPTQVEIAKRFGASLITVKRALAEIGRMGLIESVRGRGTVVRRPTVVDSHTGLSSWTDVMRDMGIQPRTTWKRIDVEPPSDELRRLLRLGRGEKLAVVRRLRTVDGEPICLMTNRFPVRLVPNLVEQGFEQESLYSVLRDRYGIEMAHADEEVTARFANAEESRVLGGKCRMVLHITRITHDANQQPIEYAEIVAPSTRYTYRVRVTSFARACSAAKPRGAGRKKPRARKVTHP